MYHDLNDRFEILKKYLYKNGSYIKNSRADIGKRISKKEDGSPVTDIDKWGNDYWEDIINTEFPGEYYIGEESASHTYPKNAEFIWYVDPIDGTKEYINGFGPYYTLIGLAYRGEPVFGIVQEPETGKIIYGSTNQKPFLLNRKYNEPLHLDGIRSWMNSNRLLMRGINAQKRKYLKDKLKVERLKYVGVTHNQLGPLFNKSSGFISNRATSYWDLCAPAAIMAAAGFVINLKVGLDSARLNDGSHRADRFYILPKDAPKEIIEAVMEW